MRFLPCVVALCLVAACHRGHDETSAGAVPAAESVLHGIVSITGTGFEQQIVLDRGATIGTIRLHASPSDSAALVRAGGAEVAVRGDFDMARRLMTVRDFTVTRVSGMPVVDGVLRLDGDRLVLETRTGRLPLGNPPAALRQMVGARVWISGPLDRGPNSYGVIVP